MQVSLEQISRSINHPDLLFQEAMAHFELWLLAPRVQLLRSDPESRSTPEALSACMQMLCSAAVKAASLSDDGYDMAVFESTCGAIEQLLQDLAARRAQAEDKAFELNPSILASTAAGYYHLPEGVLPAALQIQAEGSGLDASRRRAAVNLGSRPLLPFGPIHLTRAWQCCGQPSLQPMRLQTMWQPSWSYAAWSASCLRGQCWVLITAVLTWMMTRWRTWRPQWMHTARCSKGSCRRRQPRRA